MSSCGGSFHLPHPTSLHQVFLLAVSLVNSLSSYEEVLCVSDNDLSAAGAVGQGTLRPADRQRAIIIFGNITSHRGFTKPFYGHLFDKGMLFLDTT